MKMKLFLFCLLFSIAYASESGFSGQTSDAETSGICSPVTGSASSSDKMEIEDFEADFFKLITEDLELNEASDSSENDIIIPSSVSTSGSTSIVASADTASVASNRPTRIYPTVICPIKQEYHELFSSILDLVPSFRMADSFKVQTMQDFRYIVIVLKPHLGPLFRVVQMEYDWESIRADCKDAEDEAEFHQFIQMI